MIEWSNIIRGMLFYVNRYLISVLILNPGFLFLYVEIRSVST